LLAEPIEQRAIVWREVLGEPRPELGRHHTIVAAGQESLVRSEPMGAQAEETVDLAGDAGRIAEQALALQDQQLRGREMPDPSLELLEIEAPADVSVPVVVPAVVPGIAAEALLMPGQPL